MIQELLEKLKIERIDDVPLLLGQLERMKVAVLLDKHYHTHGNWAGALSLGQVVCVWLAYILSQGDHRLNHLQDWAEQHLGMLSALLGRPVRALDFQDDRLADILDALADAQRWSEFEAGLNGHTIRVYDLPVDTVRIDTSTVFTFGAKDDPDSLFQHGHSKDHRPGLAQIKIPLATLDPLGMPLVCTVVAGNLTDDPLYVPVIVQVQASIGESGKTYFGDCKMASLETRAYLASSHDYYVCPLSGTQVDAADLDELLKPVFDGAQTLTEVTRPAASEDDPPEVIAIGYEFTVQLTAKVADVEVTWTERRFVICSLAHQRQQQVGLQERVAEAMRELDALSERKKGKKRLSRLELMQKIERILKRKSLAGLIDVEVTTTTKERKKRKYKEREACVEVIETHVVKASVNQEAMQAALRRCGWRVYVSNHPDLTLQEVVLGYRGQYVLEGGYDRLKNQPLGLRPLYLQKEERVVGLVHLLSVGLRVLTLLEFVARRNLQKSGEKLQNVYAGQPGRKTARPSAELLLQAFKGINLYIEQHDHGTESAIKPLSRVQQRILALLELPADLYSRLSTLSNQPLLI